METGNRHVTTPAIRVLVSFSEVKNHRLVGVALELPGARGQGAADGEKRLCTSSPH